MTTTITALPIGEVHADPDQPRKLFAPGPLQELADSIAEHGLLQPIVVRPDRHHGGYVIVGGERRYRAHRLIAAETVDAIIRDDLADNDAETFMLATTENVLRADMTLMEEAHAFGRVVDLGLTADEVAGRMGKDPRWVQRRLNLLLLIPELQAMVDSGAVLIDLAQHASKLSPAAQRMLAVKLTRGDLDTQQAAKRFVRAALEAENTPALFGDADGADVVAKRENRREARQQTAAMWDTVERAADALDLVNDQSIEQIADLLAADVGPLARRLEALATAARRAAEKSASARELHGIREGITA